MSGEGKRVKDRAQTETHILNTLENLLATEGGQAVSINRVAKEAGVARTLVYRYFDNLDGLLEAYAQSETFWPSVDEVIAMPREAFIQQTFPDKTRIIMEGFANAIQQRPHTVAILSWALMESNPITALLEKRRVQTGREVRALLLEGEDLSKLDPDYDVEAILAILMAALTYLGLRQQHQPSFATINFSTPRGAKRLAQSFNYILDALNFYSDKRRFSRKQKPKK